LVKSHHEATAKLNSLRAKLEMDQMIRDDATRRMLEKHREVLLAELCGHSGVAATKNYLMFLLDVSGSMVGNMAALCEAYGQCISGRRSQGAQDVVQVILFNHQAVVAQHPQELQSISNVLNAQASGGSCFEQAFQSISNVLNAQASGGSCFEQAFQSISNALNAQASGGSCFEQAFHVAAREMEANRRQDARVVIVFMTDGVTSEADTTRSSAIAQEMFRKCAGNMILFGMTLGLPNPQSIESLVRAGNGGRTIKTMGAGSQINLILEAKKAPELACIFQECMQSLLKVDEDYRVKIKNIDNEVSEVRFRAEAETKAQSEISSSRMKFLREDTQKAGEAMSADGQAREALLRDRLELIERRRTSETRTLQKQQQEHSRLEAEVQTLQENISRVESAWQKACEECQVEVESATRLTQEAMDREIDFYQADHRSNVSDAHARRSKLGTTEESRVSELYVAVTTFIRVKNELRVQLKKKEVLLEQFVDNLVEVVGSFDEEHPAVKMLAEKRVDLVEKWLEATCNIELKRGQDMQNFQKVLHYLTQGLQQQKTMEVAVGIISSSHLSVRDFFPQDSDTVKKKSPLKKVMGKCEGQQIIFLDEKFPVEKAEQIQAELQDQLDDEDVELSKGERADLKRRIKEKDREIRAMQRGREKLESTIEIELEHLLEQVNRNVQAPVNLQQDAFDKWRLGLVYHKEDDFVSEMRSFELMSESFAEVANVRQPLSDK